MSEKRKMLPKEEALKLVFYSNKDKYEVCQKLVQELFDDRYEEDFDGDEDDDNVFNNIFSLAVKFEETGDERAWNKIEELVKKL